MSWEVGDGALAGDGRERGDVRVRGGAGVEEKAKRPAGLGRKLG